MKLSEKDVIKHSATIQITNCVNLLQRRAWNVLLANAYNDLPCKERYQVKIKDLMEVLGLEKSNHDKHIKETCKALVSCVVEWNVLDKDNQTEWGASGLLSETIIKNGTLTYAYSPTLRERLYNPAMYARISLSMQNRFSSKHALAIYELCVDYFIRKRNEGKTPFIDLAEYRKLMGLRADEYPDFKHLSKRVIKEPVREINEKSDLLVEVEYRRQARKVVALCFHIKPNPQKKALLVNLPPQGPKQTTMAEQLDRLKEAVANPELYDRLTGNYCLSPVQAKELLACYEEAYITAKLDAIKAEYDKGTIKNIGAYTYKALKEDFNFKKSRFDLEKQAAKQKAKEAEQEKERQERLKLEYDRYRYHKAEELKKTLPADELSQIETTLLEDIKKSKGDVNQYTLKFFLNTTVADYLADLAGALPFKQWVTILDQETTEGQS